MTARSSRALLALTMLTFMMVEANQGVRWQRSNNTRSSVLRPRVVP